MRSEHDQHVAGRNGLALLAANLDDLARRVGNDRDFHFHRLEHEQLVAFFHALADCDVSCQTLPVTGDSTASASSGIAADVDRDARLTLRRCRT